MMAEDLKTVGKILDRFWMQKADLRILGLMQKFYGILLILDCTLTWPDRHLFYGPGSLLPPWAVRDLLDPDAMHTYILFANTPWTVTFLLSVLCLCGLALITGFKTRMAALITFVLLTLHQHANVMLTDGEDTVFRLFAFYFIFAPTPQEIRVAINRKPSDPESGKYPIWPLRFFQLQICLIYLSTAIHKSDGPEWLDGTALYYVMRLDDMVLFPLPGFLVNWLPIMRLMSWVTLLFEFAFPFLVWFPSMKKFWLTVAFVFHLGLAYSMNLHLFQYLMILGLVSFVPYDSVVSTWEKLKAKFHLLITTIFHSKTAASVER